MLFFFFAKNSGCSKSGVRLAFGALVAALWSILVYAPNPFFDTGGRLYHAHAYTNSIMNVARLKPFDNYNLSIYGHYGLLYLPLVKLLGNNYLAIATSISIFTFITYYCVASTCEKTIENDYCYIFSIVAMGITPVMFNTGGQYYQINPHRVLFPAVSLFSVVMFQRKQFSQLTRYIIEIALGTVALIWNVETGLVSIATLALYNILSDFNVERKPFMTGIKCLIFVFSCAVFSYLLVNAYSFLTGAHTWMPWKRFIYPIASDTYSITALSMKWPTPYSLFVLQLIVFSLALMSVLFLYAQKRTERPGDTSIFLACTAVSGLGAVSYFANRAAYANIAISCVQMLIITGTYGGEAIIALRSNSIMRKRNILQLSGKLFMLFCTFIFGVETILLFGITLSNRINGNWKIEEFKHFLTTVDELVPANTVGMGRGVPELFFQLGRDTKCVLTDWSDMNSENLERAHDILEAHDGYLFLNQDSCDEIDNIKDYEIVDKVAFGDEVFILYCKRNASF